MKNILFIAPPAAGKGTQASLLSKKYGIPHISTGSLLRRELSLKSVLGNQIQECIEQGRLVEDSIILQLIEKRISMPDCRNGYILDGFPRTVFQAEVYDSILEKMGKQIDAVILLELSMEDASKRVLGRATCSNCGSIYNTMIESTMPKCDGVCDDCGGMLESRVDDTLETFTIRYQTYVIETKPLIDFYKKKGIVYSIDSNDAPMIIFEKIEKIVMNHDSY